MKLIDTNVIVSAWDQSEPLYQWAKDVISHAVSTDGACASAVTVAELCAYPDADKSPEKIVEELSGMLLKLVDVPVAASALCGSAYKKYLEKRRASSGKAGPRMPLPDFFIGAQAEVMGFELVTNDAARFRTYFPSVKLIVP